MTYVEPRKRGHDRPRQAESSDTHLLFKPEGMNKKEEKNMQANKSIIQASLR